MNNDANRRGDAKPGDHPARHLEERPNSEPTSLDGIEQAWHVEVKRRLDRARRGETQFVDGDKVMARLAREFG